MLIMLFCGGVYFKKNISRLPSFIWVLKREKRLYFLRCSYREFGMALSPFSVEDVCGSRAEIEASDYWMDNPKIKNELIITRGPTRLSN